MKILAALWRLVLWLLDTPRSCDRPGCTDLQPCDDCVAFWSIK